MYMIGPRLPLGLGDCRPLDETLIERVEEEGVAPSSGGPSSDPVRRRERALLLLAPEPVGAAAILDAALAPEPAM